MYITAYVEALQILKYQLKDSADNKMTALLQVSNCNLIGNYISSVYSYKPHNVNYIHISQSTIINIIK